MNIRTKTKRRLAILISITLVLIVSVTTLFVYRNSQIEAEMQAARAEGIAAAEAEDYASALPLLSKYVRHEREDVEALYYYALSRREVEDPRNRHIREPLGLFRAVLDLDSGHVEARRRLLELYVMVGYSPEAIDLADEILVDDPGNAEALLAKARAMEQQQEHAKAMEWAQKAVEQAPENVEAHLLIATLMKRLENSNEQIQEYARKLVEASLENPRFELVMGYTYLLANDASNAVTWLTKAADRQPPSDDFVRLLVRYLDAARMFPKSLAVLKEHVPTSEDRSLRRELARRLLEQGDTKGILTIFEKSTPEDSMASSELLAIKAMSLLDEGDQAAAEPYLVELEARQDGDPVARGWVLYMRNVVVNPPKNQSEIVDILQQALTADPTNVFVRYRLGEAYTALGETEMAITEWRRIVGGEEGRGPISRSFALPLIRLSQVYNATGRPVQAGLAAQAAMRRAPRNGAALLALLNAKAEAIDSGADTTDPAQLLQSIEKLQELAPGEENTLALYVELLIEAGRKEDAAKAIEAAIADKEKLPSEKTLIRLAGLSAEHELNLSDKLFAVTEQAHGQTPAYAYAQAIRLAAAGDSEKAIEGFERAMSQHGGDSLNWQVAWARLLDAVGDERAGDIWKSLAQKHANNVRIQRLVLGANAMQSDRSFLDATIERLRKLSDGEGLTWRIARARWLLASEGTQQQAQEAITMLQEIVSQSPDLVEVRLLLAAAHQKVGSRGSAIEQLEQALALAPERVELAIQLAGLRVADNDYSGARRMIEALLQNPDQLRNEYKQRIGRLLAQMGDYQRAATLLEETTGGADLALAEMYIRRNELSKAEAVYRKLMEGELTAELVRSYATFLGATGRVDDAIKQLALLKTLDLTPGVRETIVAEFNSRFVSADAAVEQYRAATKVAPNNPAVWRLLINFLIQSGKIDEALATNDEALAKNPGDQVFSLLQNQKDLIKSVARGERIRPLITSVIQSEDNREASLRALRIMYEADQNELTMPAVLAELRKLADKYPQHRVLHNLLASIYLNTGQPEEAAVLASRTMQKFPTDSGSAEIAARALAAQGRWTDARITAEDWRQRTLTNPRDADVLIAEAYLQNGDTTAALNQLERYATQAASNPSQFFPIVALRAQALIQSGRVDEAATMLKPQLTQHPQWRALWMRLAVTTIREPATAAAWLERVEPVIPQGDLEERTSLATNWFALGQRFDNAEYRQTALSQLQNLTSAEDAPAALIASYAVMAYQLGEMQLAEQQYRRALAAKPDLMIAANNLAVLIADEGGDLDEALELANQAVKAKPNVANFYDTLAHVERARKNPDGAIEALRKAVELEPNNPEWHINLARIFAEKGDRDAARQALRDFEALRISTEQLPTSLRERLQSVREIAAGQAAVSTP